MLSPEACWRHAVTSDEPPVEVGETQETFTLFAGVRGGPGSDGGDLG